LDGEELPELPLPNPELPEDPKPLGEGLEPGDIGLVGELEPNPEEDPEPKPEFVPPPSKAAFAFSCSILGS
jgi:hypothetical protein